RAWGARRRGPPRHDPLPHERLRARRLGAEREPGAGHRAADYAAAILLLGRLLLEERRTGSDPSNHEPAAAHVLERRAARDQRAGRVALGRADADPGIAGVDRPWVRSGGPALPLRALLAFFRQRLVDHAVRDRAEASPVRPIPADVNCMHAGDAFEAVRDG